MAVRAGRGGIYAVTDVVEGEPSRCCGDRHASPATARGLNPAARRFTSAYWLVETPSGLRRPAYVKQDLEQP